MAGDDLEQQGGVGDGGGEGPDLVERRGEGDEPVAGDQAVGGLQPHHAAEGGRLADRAAGIGAQGDRGEAGGDRRPFPPLEPPGTRLRSWGFRVGPNAEFSVDEPMANSSSWSSPRRSPQPPAAGSRRWRRRAGASSRGCATAGVGIRGGQVVLQGDGDARHGAGSSPAATRRSTSSAAAGLVGQDEVEGVDVRLPGGDGGQVLVDHVTGPDPAGPDLGGDGGRGREGGARH